MSTAEQSGAGDSAPTSSTETTASEVKIRTRGVDVFYGDKQAIKSVDIDIVANAVTAFIGPSGCGKSTFLRALNRMNDTIQICRVTGDLRLDGQDIYNKKVDPVEVRRRIGMVFQKSNPFPKSIFENVAFGLRIAGVKDKDAIAQRVEESLRGAALWDELKDRLEESALGLSGGQQQRLCIARTLATRPEVILMDEPTSALDPIATARIEELLRDLKGKYTIVIVTHSMQQAARVSDYTAFFYMGELIEYGETDQVFTRPVNKKTEEYISGRFG